MGLIIDDGKGDGASAGVTNDNRLQVESKSNVRGFYVSRDEERLFNVVFEQSSSAAGNYVGYMKNTSTTRRLIIDLARLQADSAAIWKIYSATGTATGGITATAKNMNLESALTPEATLLQYNVGGFVASSALIASERHPANTSSVVPFDDTLILGQNNAVAFQYNSGVTGKASVTVRFYYEDV